MIAPIYAGPRLPREMGFMPGANWVGWMRGYKYRTQDTGRVRRSNVAHIGFASGASLGAVSTTMAAVAVNAGYNSADIAALSAAGATDQDMIDLLEGNTNVANLFIQYGLASTPTSSSVSLDVALQSIATQAGISVATLQTLIAGGADDADLANLVDGGISAAQLAANLGVDLPAGVAASTSSPATAPSAQVPSGSILSWTVTYSNSVLGVAGGQTASSFISSFAAGLAALGYALVASSIIAAPVTGVLGGSTTITFNILDSIGNAKITDVQGNLTNLANQISGNSVTSSSIPAIISSPAVTGVVPASAAAIAAPAVAATSATSLTAWVESNALMLGLGIFALVIGAGYIKSK